MTHARTLVCAALLCAPLSAVGAPPDIGLHDGPATAGVPDTSLWDSVERSLGLEHRYRTRSPRDACMLLRREGLHLFEVSDPTALDIALLHDVGCTIVLLSQYHFYVFSDLSFHDFTFAREMGMARRHSDLFWETLTGYRAVERDEPMRPFDFELATSMHDTSTYTGNQQLLSTLRKVERHRYVEWRSDTRYVKKQVHGIWAIAPHGAARVTKQTEELMNGLGLSLAFRPADIEPLRCMIDTSTLAERIQTDRSLAAVDTPPVAKPDTPLVTAPPPSSPGPVETAGPRVMPLTEGIVRPALRPNALQLTKGVRQAVGGNVVYWLSIVLEHGMLTPMAANVRTAEGALGVLMLSVPVSAMRIASVPTACAGASNVYEYRRSVDPAVPDIHVWKPYAVGWGLTAVSTLFELLGSLSANNECLTTALVFAYARDVVWGVAGVWSLVYALRGKHEPAAKSNGTIGLAPIRTPRGGGGIALVASF